MPKALELVVEGEIAIPLENAHTAAILLEEWFEGRFKTAIHPLGYLGMTEDERRVLAFGIHDLNERLKLLDERVSGPQGICPR